MRLNPALDLAILEAAVGPSSLDGAFPQMVSSNANGKISSRMAEPVPLPDLLPVPVLSPDMLPKPLRLWLCDIAERMQCPLEYVVAPALVALGGLIGNKLVVMPKANDSWPEACNLWGCAVGDPGDKKSPAAEAAMMFIKEIERELWDEYREIELRQSVDRKARDAEKKAIERRLEQCHGGPNSTRSQTEQLVDEASLKERLLELERIKDIPQRRISTSDATVEKLGIVCSENPTGIICRFDELESVLATFEKPDRKRDRHFYLQGWNGLAGDQVDRVGRGSMRVERVCLSVWGTIQPAVMKRHIDDASHRSSDDGLLQRFQILVYPDQKRDFSYVDHIPQGVHEARQIFKGVFAFDPADRGFPRLTDDAGGHSFIKFSPDAQDCFKIWLTEQQRKVRSVSFVSAPLLRSHYAKYQGLMPRLAAIFQIVDLVAGEDQRLQISLKNAVLASKWCTFLLSHAQRFYGIGSAAEMVAAKALLQKLQDGQVDNVFAARDIYRKGWSGLTDRKKVEEALSILVEYGWLSRYEGAPGDHGGRPRTCFCLLGELTDKTDKTYEVDADGREERLAIVEFDGQATGDEMKAVA